MQYKLKHAGSKAFIVSAAKVLVARNTRSTAFVRSIGLCNLEARSLRGSLISFSANMRIEK